MREHNVGDKVKLVNWEAGYDEHHPRCEGEVIEIITDITARDIMDHKTEYYVKVLWENGKTNVFYKPWRHLKVVSSFGIQQELFEI